MMKNLKYFIAASLAIIVVLVLACNKDSVDEMLSLSEKPHKVAVKSIHDPFNGTFETVPVQISNKEGIIYFQTDAYGTTTMNRRSRWTSVSSFNSKVDADPNTPGMQWNHTGDLAFASPYGDTLFGTFYGITTSNAPVFDDDVTPYAAQETVPGTIFMYKGNGNFNITKGTGKFANHTGRGTYNYRIGKDFVGSFYFNGTISNWGIDDNTIERE